MQWDMGFLGLAVLGAISLGFGVLAGLVVGQRWAFRLWAIVTATVGCFVVGLFTSEGLFGWATEEDLQPNVDGLSRDEVLLSSLLTTVVVVLVMRYLAHHSGGHGGARSSTGGSGEVDHPHGQPTGHA
jgi:hypothetical protein